jgi:hypothetical protein
MPSSEARSVRSWKRPYFAGSQPTSSAVSSSDKRSERSSSTAAASLSHTTASTEFRPLTSTPAPVHVHSKHASRSWQSFSLAWTATHRWFEGPPAVHVSKLKLEYRVHVVLAAQIGELSVGSGDLAECLR